MKVSLKWLNELVKITLSAEELGEILTIAGFEVEEIIDLRELADGVVIGKVVDCQPHPNADKLRVCQVDIGEENLSNIVCGAPNVRSDVLVAVATLGSYLPAVDLKLKPVKLRGVPSQGMICSLAELGLTKDSEGIHIFNDSTLETGMDVRPLLGLDDVILDLTTTANRADALSMVGVAREVAALTGTQITLPPVESLSGSIPADLAINITDSHACPIYVGTVIEGVKITDSPDWLKSRLQNAGIRAINNVVDATNYILLEWGQPLHAFDREKLLGLGNPLNLGVRFSYQGETIQTLDSQKRELKPQNLLITANDVPVAIAGVMGGETTEVDDNTTNIVLESAIFDSVVIRRSARSQSLRTESSSRYERGINQAEFPLALQRAIALITELAGGQVVSQTTAGNLVTEPRVVTLRYSRLQQVLGKVQEGTIPRDKVESILQALGCRLEFAADNQSWDVTIPPYRQRDLEREIDLIEEVARLYGYDQFCAELPTKTQPGYLSTPERVKRQLRSLFRSIGLTEVVHYSLVSSTEAELVINNPLFKEYSGLRTNLLTGLIEACGRNVSQGNGVLNACEIGRVFHYETTITETEKVAGILGGDRYLTGSWLQGGKVSSLSWYEAKGLLESVFTALNLPVEYRATDTYHNLHPGRTASLWLDGQELGCFGQIHPQLATSKDLPPEVYVFELSFPLLLEVLSKKAALQTKFTPYSTYPAITRDLAFFVSNQVTVAQLTAGMMKVGGKLLETVELFDQYQGENVPSGQRSLAFSLVYRVSDRTLTEADIEPVHQKVRDTLVKDFQVTLRS
ncbi:MAG: phenylalanine--tRNA ligase subunit beta [Gloeocapsa sp. DLM2.Bin57]|nr:MAG: phenylalanine--tRNA ligase subunit beta [Gloeocapsa sp. DLM2.Bin57]